MVPVCGGRESGLGGSLGATTPAAHLLSPAEASAVPDPPPPGPAGLLPVGHPCAFWSPQARRGLGTGASTDQALSSGATRELAMTSQGVEPGKWASR